MKAVCEYADRHSMLEGCSLLVCAVSGGADSMCLLHVMQGISAKRGFSLAAAHFNHRLRGEVSDSDETFVAEYCRNNGIPLKTGSGDVVAYALENSIGIEEAARELRYEFFESTAREFGADRVATAHNADDNAETMILNLIRGTGLRGLSGIPPVRGKYIRPLLCLARKEILAYLADNGIGHVEDSTNAEPICSRNIIRLEIMPVLKALNPDISAAALRCAEMLRADDAYIEAQAAAFPKEARDGGDKTALDAGALSVLPVPVASRVVRSVAGEFGISLSEAHVDAVLKLCGVKSPSAGADLPDGLTAAREYGKLVFSRSIGEEDGFAEKELVFGEWTQVPELGLEFFLGDADSVKINTQFNIFFFKKETVCGKIIVRPRKTGDKIKLSLKSGTKSLKKLFIEKKIPAAVRSKIPVVSDEMGVIAVFGIGTDCERSARSDGSLALASRPIESRT